MKTIRVYQNEPYKKLGDLYGLFFEDINHAADGGLYAELVQNRSFEFDKIDRWDYHSFTAWEKSEGIDWEIRTEHPLNKENTHYVHIKAEKGADIRNLGFNTGIFVEEGKQYDFSVYARGNAGAKIRVFVTDADGECCTAEDGITVAGACKNTETADTAANGWKKYELILLATKTTVSGRLVLNFTEATECDLDMVSLFPQDTFLAKKGGLRKDIAEALKEMKPKFMRFPGGCLTHDGSLNEYDRNSMYRWRRTLGPIEARPTWRSNWGYNQTLGLGYFEYFCFCEEIGAKPLPVVPGGFNPHRGEGVPIDEIGYWVQETLDLIEFANGDVTTPYGKVRAEMGHPAPFGLEYLGVGNEEIGDGFFERYPYFHNAIREKYPEIKIINTAGPFAVGEGYDAGWESAKKYGSDLVDEHYYSSPEWFLGNMHHYEDYDENGPKVFLGEYASWGNTYYNAIVEAAYMTHLERAKAVALACYAPMLCNVDYVNWRPDMLWFHNHAIVKTPNYHVQKMFMVNQGTDEVRFETEGLSEVIRLSDTDRLAGDITIGGNDVEGRIWDIRVTENAGNAEDSAIPCGNSAAKVIEFPEITVTKENKEHLLCHTECESYTLEFKFKRSEGRKGLRINVGKTQNESTLWEFGGWDNWDCNLTSFHHGRSSVISHRIFHVGDIEYTLRIEVNGRNIRTYVNGELYNNTVNALPEIEEIYVAASTETDESGKKRTIVKAVNLTGEEKEVKLVLEGERRSKLLVTQLSGHGLTEENSFEEPEKIVPESNWMEVKENTLLYRFPKHSVTVLSFEE